MLFGFNMFTCDRLSAAMKISELYTLHKKHRLGRLLTVLDNHATNIPVRILYAALCGFVTLEQFYIIVLIPTDCKARLKSKQEL